MQTVRVNIVDALAVDPLTIDGQVLRYPKLAGRIDELAPLVNDAKKHLQSDAADAFTTHHLRREIESYELLCTAQAIQEVATLSEERLLAVQFTKLSKQLYGAPDLAVASHLANEALIGFRAWRSQVGKDDLQRVEAAYEKLIYDHGKVDPIHAEALAKSRALQAELLKRYGNVFALVKNRHEAYSAAEAASILESVLSVLATSDSAWSEWTIFRKPEAAICSVSGQQKQINVGLRRPAMTADELKGVIAHEVLVHAQRAINGSKVDRLLGAGLPGYVAAEEGVAILMEFAMTGTIPYKIFDRYIDISLALRGMTRRELFTVALARAQMRAQVEGSSLSSSDLHLITWAQTNRIYRGTKGDDVVGVFTKDAGYYTGFASIVAYTAQQQEKGASIPAILDFFFSAKFDPKNKQHLEYLAKLGLPTQPVR